MSDTTPNSQPLASLATALGPRGSIAALIAVHFALSILHVWPFPIERLGESWWWLPEMLIPALDAIPQAQIALIAVYVTLGSGRWLARFVRGALLLLWLELAHMIGTRWLADGRDATSFEEFLGQNVWHFVIMAVPLLIYRLVVRRQLVHPDAAAQPPFQFRIWHLLLITTEAAALLAAIRAFVSHNRQWRDELWRAVRDYLPYYATYDLLVFMLLCVIPAVLVTLHRRSLWRAALVLLIWVHVLATGFAAYRFGLAHVNPQLALADLDQPAWMWGALWLGTVAAGGSMTFLIWLTIAVVRWLGYDFLPVRRGGRHSSDATSAA